MGRRMWLWVRQFHAAPKASSTLVPRNTQRMPRWPPIKPPNMGPVTCPVYWAEVE